MEQRTDRLYPWAPLETIELEQRLKKIKDFDSFFNHISKIKDMIAYYKDENNTSKKKYKTYETPITILESEDLIVVYMWAEVVEGGGWKTLMY